MKRSTALLAAGAVVLALGAARTASRSTAIASHASLPSHAELRDALIQARNADNGGLDTDMWATVVDRDGVVFAVAFTGAERGDQWPGSRVISTQKANAANAFSLDGLSLSTANLFSAVQPNGSLFGLQHSNPVDVRKAYRGDPERYGQFNDPMVRARVGGVNVFGGGLALYDESGDIVGAIGVSGDTSCADHNIAWRTRNLLRLDYVPAGVNSDPDRPDNIIFDIEADADGNLRSLGGFGHPHCLVGNEMNEEDIANALPPVR